MIWSKTVRVLDPFLFSIFTPCWKYTLDWKGNRTVWRPVCEMRPYPISTKSSCSLSKMSIPGIGYIHILYYLNEISTLKTHFLTRWIVKSKLGTQLHTYTYTAFRSCFNSLWWISKKIVSILLHKIARYCFLLLLPYHYIWIWYFGMK